VDIVEVVVSVFQTNGPLDRLTTKSIDIKNSTLYVFEIICDYRQLVTEGVVCVNHLPRDN